LKDGNNSASSIKTNVVVNKGTPKVSLAIKPDTNTITNKVTLTTTVSGMIFNTQNKWYTTLKFYNKAYYNIKLMSQLRSIATVQVLVF